MNRDSVVGITTGYGLDGPGSNPVWGARFSSSSRRALGLAQAPVKWVPGLFPGVKRPERGVDHSPTSSTKAKERVDLYLFSPFGPSWPVLG